MRMFHNGNGEAWNVEGQVVSIEQSCTKSELAFFGYLVDTQLIFALFNHQPLSSLNHSWPLLPSSISKLCFISIHALTWKAVDTILQRSS